MKYNKLVRDKIPQIIEATGKEALIEKLNEAEYKLVLTEKLQEPTLFLKVFISLF